MTLDAARKRYKEYFTEKVETFGATAEGVDYNGQAAQQTRFAELVKVIEPAGKFSVIDYGCGYGGLCEFMQAKGWKFEYYGLDFIEKMVSVGLQAHAGFPEVHFTAREDELPVSDYVIAGSIFNNKFQADLEEWTEQVQDTLRRIDKLCRRGFSFNMLTKYSDAERMAERPDLYYADPLHFFDFCKRNFSRNVALLHDYGLYDFTILVRKSL